MSYVLKKTTLIVDACGFAGCSEPSYYGICEKCGVSFCPVHRESEMRNLQMDFAASRTNDWKPDGTYMATPCPYPLLVCAECSSQAEIRELIEAYRSADESIRKAGLLYKKVVDKPKSPNASPTAEPDAPEAKA